MKRAVTAYAVLIALIAWWIAAQHRGAKTEQNAEPPMQWSEVKKDVPVDAKPKGVWTWAVDYVRGPALILIEATGNWSYSKGATCGADGDLNALITSQNAILSSAPIGALIVKIGGSTAGVNDGTIRVAGTRAVIQIDDKVSGPILLTINDEIGGLADNEGALTVTLSMAAVPAPPPAAPKPDAQSQS